MSQFEGSALKVRCIDCTSLAGNRCSAKNTKVAPKKRRICSQYHFKGEYENRTPANSVYIPYVDKKTRKYIQNLLQMGVVPIAEDGSVETKDGFAKVKTLPMPRSTATVTALKAKAADDPIIYETLDKTYNEESEDSGS